MSFETIRQKMNRPELDYIWEHIKEGELDTSLHTSDIGVLMHILAVYTAILLSGEYKIQYFVRTVTGLSDLYDEPDQIPQEFLDQGLIQIWLSKVDHEEPTTSN